MVKKPHAVAIAICCALLAMGVAAASATASTLLWLVNQSAGEGKATVFSENKGLFRIDDMGASTAIECESETVYGLGTVGPEAQDETTEVTFAEPLSTCKPSAKALNQKGEEVANTCEKFEEVKAIDLPWLTLVELAGGVIKDKIAPDGKGQPGYTFTCLVSGKTLSDECKTTEGHEQHVELKNLPETEELLAPIVSAISHAAAAEAMRCSVGGAESGLVTDEIDIYGVEVGEQQPAASPLRFIRGNTNLFAVAGTEREETLEFRNEEATETIEIRVVQVTNYPTAARVFRERSNTCRGRIAARRTCQIRVGFRPTTRGHAYDGRAFLSLVRERFPNAAPFRTIVDLQANGQ